MTNLFDFICNIFFKENETISISRLI